MTKETSDLVFRSCLTTVAILEGCAVFLMALLSIQAALILIAALIAANLVALFISKNKSINEIKESRPAPRIVNENESENNLI